MAQVFSQVYSIERIRALYDMAREHLRVLKLSRIRLTYGDGMAGLPGAAPFDAIVVAAAGLKVPQALLSQLAIGGILIAPEGVGTQRLVKIQRTGVANWERQELEEVRFVPLKAGVQT
jgi:protein-L-isoaspartate(D-aspartate) O-methyltransferase